MADKMDKPEFWLPSEFLTDEDILVDNKEIFFKYGFAESKPAALCMPSLFPYDCGSSPVESPVGSAETESDEEDSLLTELTQQLTLREAQKLTSSHQNHEKGLVLSGSPQSTLTQVGSWSGRSTVSSNGSPNGPSQVSSPPTTPLRSKNDAWDLIYQAAGEVARLKINGGDGIAKNPGLMRPQKCLTTPPPPKNPSLPTFHHSPWQQVNGEQVLKQEGCGTWSGQQLKNRWSYDPEVFQNRGGRVGVAVRNGSTAVGGFLPSSCAWPTLQAQQRNQPQFGDLNVGGSVPMGGGFGYGYGYGSGSGYGGVKRECAGTGVFLPRRYDNNNPRNISDLRKTQGSPSWVQSRGVQALNKNFDKIGLIAQPQPQPQPQPQTQLSGVSILNHDTLARRNAISAQQRRNLCPDASIGHEICLPQEWTY